MIDIYLRIRTLYPSLSSDDFDPFYGAIKLRDDGDGPFIALWEHPTLPRPTEQQLLDVEPREPVPQVVTQAQGKAALILAGKWQAVLDYVDSITDPTQRALADVALHATSGWRRASPFLGQAAAAVGLDDDDLDDLFRQAATIEL